MKTTRLLLPFTHGVDTLALEYGVLFAKSCNATLVPLSLIPVPKEKGSKSFRLEQIQQSQDFLASVQHKAARHAVQVEPMELLTSDVVGSIEAVLQDLQCDDILLFMQDSGSSLLDVDEAKHIMSSVASKQHIISLPPSKEKESTPAHLLFKRVSGLLRSRAERQAAAKLSFSHKSS